MNNKDIREKLGQLLFIGIQGYTLTPNLKKTLTIIQPGGVILFEHNTQTKKQVQKLNKNLCENLKTKPFITCDQEGGSVERLRRICTSVPSPWGLAKYNEKALLETQSIIASELIELGFNMTLSPTLDVNTNKANPIINTRALSNLPNVVANLGNNIIKLYLKNNLIPVAKHFPGHGDLKVDSHLALPVLNKSKRELHKLEFIPFTHAIKSNIPIIMVSHIQLPQIDKKVPASISKEVINNILQKELKFKGLIITDDLTMRGITKHLSIADAVYKAILAGADLALINSNEKTILKVYDSLLKKVIKDSSLQKRINESYQKIILTKRKYLKRKSVKLKSTSQNAFHAHKIAQNVVHWIKKDLFFTPISKNDPLNIIYPVSPKVQLSDLEIICNKLKLKRVKFIPYNINPTNTDTAKVLSQTHKKSRKVVLSYNAYAWNRQKILLNKILDIDSDITVIALGLEFDLELAPRIKCFIAAYAPNYVSLLVAFEKLCSKIKSKKK